MKIQIFPFVLLVVIVMCLTASTYSQDDPFKDYSRLYPPKGIPAQKEIISAESLVSVSTNNYRSTDWRKRIDSYWGPGLPISEKLAIFDAFWETADRRYGGFPNLTINWDSIRTRYRPEVEAGVSRGRFSAIMTQLQNALQEVHTFVRDAGVDSTFFIHPNIGSWRISGVPLFTPGAYGITTTGFGLSPLPDSSLLVYRALPYNPLGLKAGDIVLGYERKKWVDILAELDSIQMPWSYGLLGSSPESFTYTKLNSAGLNWHLFDTIDVVRYATGDTVHLSLKPLAAATPGWDALYCTDQIPVPGVFMPDVFKSIRCSWGIIPGTSIGYIYSYNWSTVKELFTAAILQLKGKTTGIILDYRFNTGGNPSQGNDGYSHLFNEDIDGFYELAHRSSMTNHFSFNHQSISSSWIGPFYPTAELYEYPIAVLMGPASLSAGDYNAFRMRFHPMARSFGKRTNTGYVTGYYSEGTLVKEPWKHRLPHGGTYSNYNHENFLIHKGFSVDEEVWLTRAGAAKGEDDVVKRALEWITTLTHAHGTILDRSNYRAGLDSITLKATLTNPLNHSTAISAIVTSTSTQDSMLLYNNGLHGDGTAGDNIWGRRFLAPSHEDIFAVSIRTDDITNGTYRRLPNVHRFTTAGPLKLDSIELTVNFLGIKSVKPYIRNYGKNKTIKGAVVRLWSNDPWLTNPFSAIYGLPDIPPGSSSPAFGKSGIVYQNAIFPGYVNFKAEVTINGYPYWIDSTKLIVTTVDENKRTIPTDFRLEQNYPNPFNPTTTIRYALPSSAQVKLTIHDILGREVATLVNEEQSAGWKEVEWKAAGYASGVYFYRLQAGQFVEMKKMIVVK